MLNSARIISVNTAPPYNVYVGSGLLSGVGSRLAQMLTCRHAAVITDSNVAPLYLGKVVDGLKDAGFAVSSHIFPAGEANKNFETLSGILEFLAQQHLTRSDCIIALGGGVVGDMAGFAAGCYQRGVRCIQIPTTLLSAVDSSVGGKTAINLKAGKNLAGVFLQPTAVFCDTDCLQTLDTATFADGAAEAIKTGILCDEGLFSLFERGDLTGRISEIIARCVAYKAGVVERDEKEMGERKLLNLGHTVGHAIEVCSGYTIPHGHAVAAGLAIAARSAETLGWTAEPIAGRIADCLAQNALPVTTDFSAQVLAAAAAGDKKRSGSEITIAVPRKIGACELKKIPVSDILPFIQAGLEV